MKRPVEYADIIGQEYTRFNAPVHKKNFGQYLTPVSVADFMGGMISARKQDEITILDPGIGAGILACAVCEKAVEKISGLKKINIIGYEIDSGITDFTEKSLQYLVNWLRKKSVDCFYTIIKKDFILNNESVIEDDGLLFKMDSIQKADIVISNPPYFKINKDDPRSVVASKVVHGQPNIYSLFMAISAYLLNDDGELIFITPRSYTSGFYFKSFRDVFFSKIRPLQFHLFASRKEAFVRDDVLQEHLIMHGKRKVGTKKNYSDTVIISSSCSSSDLDTPVKRKAVLKDVVDYDSINKYIFLPLSDEEEDIISFVNSWSGSLHKYNMEISTGRVVPFRVESLLKMKHGDANNLVPFIWMNHIKPGKLEWPIENFRKEQYIISDEYSLPVLVPNSNYVLMRRFSPKEDDRRINTAPLFNTFFKNDYLGFENHVNYIHRPGGELLPEEISGLSAILNSRYLDIYFRTLNGNTEVSATEMRNIPLPNHELICGMGREIIKKGLHGMDIEKMITAKKIGAA